MSIPTLVVPRRAPPRPPPPTPGSKEDWERSLQQCLASSYDKFLDETNWAPRRAVSFRHTEEFGASLWAAELIPKGRIVTEYVGEPRYLVNNSSPSTHVIKLPGVRDWAVDGLPLRERVLNDMPNADVRALGAFVNSARPKDSNLVRRWTGPQHGCRLFFEASRDITAGEQLFYTYLAGDVGV